MAHYARVIKSLTHAWHRARAARGESSAGVSRIFSFHRNDSLQEVKRRSIDVLLYVPLKLLPFMAAHHVTNRLG